MTNSETTIFVYDGTGKLVAEYSTKTPPPSPTTNYTATDPLGSPRVVTNRQGQIISRRDFMPFGEELAPDSTYRTANLKYGAGDSVRQKFTGYQRDEETNLDFAEARYYDNSHGRFTAVDPLLASGKSANPQTFNRYAYTMNRPLILTDSSGLQAGRKISLSGSTGKLAKPAQPAQYAVIPGTTNRVQISPEIPGQIDPKSVVPTNSAVNKILSDYATKVYNNEVAAGVATDSLEGAKGVGTLKSITLEVSVGGDVSGKDAGKVSTELGGSAEFAITDPSDIEQARRQANGDLYNSAADQLSETSTETTFSPNKPVQLTEDQIKGLLTDAGRIAKDEASKRRDSNKESNDDSDKIRRRP